MKNTMNIYLIPFDDSLIEDIAKAILKNRVLQEIDVIDADGELNELIKEQVLDKAVDQLDSMWADVKNEAVKERFRDDARIAISTMNLKLLTLPG